MSIYIQAGYFSRKHYLQCLASDMGVPLTAVLGLASILGPSEDFDGLVTELEDLVQAGAFDEAH